jgi:hypothetical protein
MKKKMLVLAIVVVMVFAFTPFASAKRCYDPYHKGPVGFLYLIQKDLEWNPVLKGAYGRMQYHIWGEEFSFWFEGHGLVQGEKYTLIYYPDPWPGAGLICLGEGTAYGRGGNVAIWGRTDLGMDLPADYDANAKTILPSGAVGAKIWLVLSEDVDCGTATGPMSSKLIGWNPLDYLFEFNLITYYDTTGDDAASKKKK